MARSFTPSQRITLGGTTSLEFPMTSGCIFTASFWMKLNDWTAAGSRNIVGAGYVAASQKGWLIYWVGGITNASVRFKAHFSNGSTAINSNPGIVITDNNWHHVIVRGFGPAGTVGYFIDGTGYSNGTISGSGGSSPMANATVMGTDPVGTAGNAFSGQLAELALWDSILSTADCNTLRYYSPEFATVKPFVYYPMFGRESIEPDMLGRVNGTLTSAPAQFSHPPVIRKFNRS